MRKREVDGKQTGNVDEAFKTAARVIEAEYEWPFQSHACMGPACALVEIKDGKVTLLDRLAEAALRAERHRRARSASRSTKVHVHLGQPVPAPTAATMPTTARWTAAVLAKAVGKPVRLQYTREQGTGWDPKGPASIHRARAAIDANGNVIAYEFTSKGFSRVDVNTNGSKPIDTLAGQSRGIALKSGDGFGVPAESYEFANKRTAWETIPPLLDRASPLRTSHLRDPVGPQIHFASESFMDEVAAALEQSTRSSSGCKHVKDPRDIAVIKAAAREVRLGARGPRRDKDQTGNKVTGRGIAYAQRNGTRVAIVAEVDIDRTTGKIWARKFTVAHDCGQIINPDGLSKCIEGNVVQGISRTLWEEVKFDNKNVTSVDWHDLSDPRHHRDAGDDRLRADRPAGAAADRRRRAVDAAAGGGDRQRDLRRHRRAHPPRAVLARPGEAGAVVGSAELISEAKGPAAMPGLFRSSTTSHVAIAGPSPGNP